MRTEEEINKIVRRKGDVVRAITTMSSKNLQRVEETLFRIENEEEIEALWECDVDEREDQLCDFMDKHGVIAEQVCHEIKQYFHFKDRIKELYEHNQALLWDKYQIFGRGMQ